MCIPPIVARQRLGNCIPPLIVRQRLGKHVPAATNTRNNRRIVGRVCLWICLCIPMSLLGNNSVKTFPRQPRIDGGVVFCAVRVVSEKRRRLVLPITSCSSLHFALKQHCQPKYQSLAPTLSKFLSVHTQTVYLTHILTLSFHLRLGSQIVILCFTSRPLVRVVYGRIYATRIYINRTWFMTMYVCYLTSCMLCRSHDVVAFTYSSLFETVPSEGLKCNLI
jgi:hypothetical protein